MGGWKKITSNAKKKNYLSGWFLFWSIEFFTSHFAEVFHFMETKIHHFFWNWKYFSHLNVLICSYESVSQCDKLFWPGFINPRYLLAFCTSTWVLLITWGQRWAQITLFIKTLFFCYSNNDHYLNCIHYLSSEWKKKSHIIWNLYDPAYY